MYNLYFLKKVWRIEVDSGGYFEGSLKEVTAYCETYLAFSTKEIDAALDDMVKKKTDSAHFGVIRSFIYSFDREHKEMQEKGMRYGLH